MANTECLHPLRTLSDIENLPREFLTAAEVADVLRASPNTIRWQAQHDPQKLGFPVIVIGRRVKIPKQGFIYFCRYGNPVKESETL